MQILKDVEEKAPKFERQRRELDSLEQRCRNLTQQLDKANYEYTHLEEALRNAERTIAHHEREMEMQAHDIAHLSKLYIYCVPHIQTSPDAAA